MALEACLQRMETHGFARAGRPSRLLLPHALAWSRDIMDAVRLEPHDVYRYDRCETMMVTVGDAQAADRLLRLTGAYVPCP